MSPEKAMTAVRNHVDLNEHGLLPSVLVAYAVLEAVMIGVPEDPVGKAMPAEAKHTGSTTTTDASDAPKSSRSAPASDGSVTYEQTLWEIIAAIDGHNRVHGGDEKLEPPSDVQFEALLDEHLFN